MSNDSVGITYREDLLVRRIKMKEESHYFIGCDSRKILHSFFFNIFLLFLLKNKENHKTKYEKERSQKKEFLLR
jgi:membrane-bound metal-dependent hydrolase YbcI (DUF457 family)